MSTSVEAAAKVVASGIHLVDQRPGREPAPTAPIAPVATNRKSLRLGSSAMVLAAMMSSNSGSRLDYRIIERRHGRNSHAAMASPALFDARSGACASSHEIVTVLLVSPVILKVHGRKHAA